MHCSVVLLIFRWVSSQLCSLKIRSVVSLLAFCLCDFRIRIMPTTKNELGNCSCAFTIEKSHTALNVWCDLPANIFKPGAIFSYENYSFNFKWIYPYLERTFWVLDKWINSFELIVLLQKARCIFSPHSTGIGSVCNSNSVKSGVYSFHGYL